MLALRALPTRRKTARMQMLYRNSMKSPLLAAPQFYITHSPVDNNFLIPALVFRRTGFNGPSMSRIEARKKMGEHPVSSDWAPPNRFPPGRGRSSAYMQIFVREIRLAGQVDPQSPQPGFIAWRGQMGGVHLAAVNLLQLFQGQMGHGVGRGIEAETDQDLRAVEAHGFGSQDVLFKGSHGADDGRREQRDRIRDAGQDLHGVQNQARSGVHQGRV